MWDEKGFLSPVLLLEKGCASWAIVARKNKYNSLPFL